MYKCIEMSAPAHGAEPFVAAPLAAASLGAARHGRVAIRQQGRLVPQLAEDTSTARDQRGYKVHILVL